MLQLPAVLLLDGAMGTELFLRGLVWGELPERWLLERPDEVARVHAAHAAAGAELVLSCTFNLASPKRLKDAGLAANVETLAETAVRLARRSAPGALVAGAVGPTGLITPQKEEPSAETLAEWYRDAGRALKGAGVDLLWAESQWSLAEARIALLAFKETGLPVAVTLSPVTSGGSLLAGSGEALGDAFHTLVEAGAAAVGINCVLPNAPVTSTLRQATGLGVPIIAKPSAGLPGSVIEPKDFARWLVELRGAGAGWLGGCCGATPAHLAAARELLGSGRVQSPAK